MAYSTIKLAYDARVATITFNRPDKRNALSVQMIEEIMAALAEVEKSESVVLILTGAGKAFCAGMDLEELKSLTSKTPSENVADSDRMARFFRAIYEFPKPTIAAVNGAAMAGGAGIATMCDFTLALAEATFGYTEVRIGFVPAIVSSILVWQVGHKTARDLLLTGRAFEAAEAQSLGLVNEVVSPKSLLPRARELAKQLMENSPAALRMTKKLLNSYLAKSLDKQIDTAVQENAAIRTTPEFQEGVASFLEKRKPNWSGQ
jgi:methylglutaconyl-CoA hydratase